MSVHAFALPPRIPTSRCNECQFTYELPRMFSLPVPWERTRSRLVCVNCIYEIGKAARDLASMAADRENERQERREHYRECNHCSRWAGKVPPGMLARECAARRRNG